MAVKTITITMEAYDLLKAEKREHESFSDVIKRTHRKPSSSFLDFVGIMSKQRADQFERDIMQAREDNLKISEKRYEEIREAFDAARHNGPN